MASRRSSARQNFPPKLSPPLPSPPHVQPLNLLPVYPDVPREAKEWLDSLRLARAVQIRDAVYSWSRASHELEMARTLIRGHPGLGNLLRNEINAFERRVEIELKLLGLRIIAEATLDERARMGLLQPVPSWEILRWAWLEAKSQDPLQVARWECINGVLPGCSTSPQPFLSVPPSEPGSSTPMQELEPSTELRL